MDMKIRIPEKLSDIIIEDWIKFKKVQMMPDYDKEVEELALVTIFCRMSIDDARKINAIDFSEIVQQIKSVLNQEPRFIQRFIVEGKEFGFIPNLETMTAGEVIDLDRYLESFSSSIDLGSALSQ